MKYVMLEIRGPGGLKRRVPVIFPNEMVHEDVTKAIQTIAPYDKAVPVSAGDITLISGVTCDGQSNTLKLKAHKKDALTIQLLDYTHGLL